MKTESLLVVVGSLVLALNGFAAESSVVRAGAQVVAGRARFTVVSPTAIRLEYAEDGVFEDRPSILAIERPAGWRDFECQEENGTLIIETGKLTLRYPVAATGFKDHLTAQVVGSTKRWIFGSDEGNLLGTRTGLDGKKVAEVDPSMRGLLSRAGVTYWPDTSVCMAPAEPIAWWAPRKSGNRSDGYLFGYGSDYRQALRDYIAIAGRPQLLPKWAFGLWHSKAYDKDNTSAVQRNVQDYRQEGFGLDVYTLDLAWHVNGWDGWDWNTTLHPDPKALIDWLHGQGVRLALNEHTGGHGSSVDLRKESWWPAFAKFTGLYPATPYPYRILDLSIPKHAQGYMEICHGPLIKQGVDVWWQDTAQFIPDSPFIGKGNRKQGGNYWMTYVYDAYLRRLDPLRRPVQYMRWDCNGQHRYGFQFSGDTRSGWEMLASQVPYTAMAANVLAGYWSHDIGGFTGGFDRDRYVRWSQVAAFWPIFRYHGDNALPWKKVEGEHLEAVRKALQVRYRLLPYLYTAAYRFHRDGIAMCRPMYYDWPTEESAYTAGGQYMLGDNLLVAPVTAANGVKEVWFPAGAWTDYFTGEEHRGPATKTFTCQIDRIPVFVKEGGIIPHQPNMNWSMEKPVDPLTLYVYPSADGKRTEYELYEDDGASNDHLKGAHGLTRFAQEIGGRHLKVELGATNGQYANQPTRRGCRLAIHGIATKPTTVTCDGTPVEEKSSRDETWASAKAWSYDGSQRTVYVQAGVVSATQSAVVQLENVK